MYDNQIITFIMVYWPIAIICVVPIIATLFIIRFLAGRKKICVYKNTQCFYSVDERKTLAKLNLLLDEASFNEIYKTEIFLWNNGKKELQRGMTDSALVLEVKNPKGELLEFLNSQCIDKHCNISLQNTDNETMVLNLDFLNNKDGIYLEVLHTAPLLLVSSNVESVKLKTLKYLPLTYNMGISSKIIMRVASLFLFLVQFSAATSYIGAPATAKFISMIWFILFTIAYIVLVDFLPRPPKKVRRLKNKKKS